MRTCASCGMENADDADFCSCGEYLRWEPTGFIAAAKPAAPAAGEGAGAAAPEAPSAPVDPNMTLAGDTIPGRAWGAPAAPGGLGAGVAPKPGTPGFGDAPPGAAALTLRLPDDDSAAPGSVNVTVDPGQRATIAGTIRNQSEVVDNFDLWIRGLPEDWYTITPATAYLVPYGAGGVFEQDLQIHIHPPRSPEAQARPWPFEVVAESRAYSGEVVAAPASATIGPYYEVATEMRPDRASGRLKARYRLIVRNKANARTEVELSAEDTDAECQFRFAEPKIALEPGNALECPFTVFPPSQIWIGKAKERSFKVTAAPVGVDPPPAPRTAVYRQTSWLPKWVMAVAALAVVAAALIIKLAPHPAPVPKLVGLPSVFAAQKIVNKDGFTLAAKTKPVPDAKGKPIGSIADQSPPAGTKAKKGTAITLEVYAGSGKATVPSVVGLNAGQADAALLGASLTLGTASPQPLNPTSKITAQIPPSGTQVADGTAIAVFMIPASGGKGAGKAGLTGAAAVGAAAGAAGAAAAKASSSTGASSLTAAASEAGPGSLVVPKVSTDPTTAAATLSQAGLQPHLLKEVSEAPVGQVAGTVPAAGAKVAKGAVIDLIVSTGSPQLSYDNFQTISVIDPTTDKSSGTVPAVSGPEKEASWSADGTHVIYSENGQLVIDQPNVKGANPKQLTQPQSGISNVNPSFAPTLKSITVAWVQLGATSAQLCFATIGNFALNPDCTSPPSGWLLGGQVDWSPSGNQILVLGTRNAGANFGLFDFTSNVPFSTQASNWGHGVLVSNDATAGTGVFAGAFSPNGKNLALVSGSDSGGFNLYIAPAAELTSGALTFTSQQEIPGISACQVAWRPDGQELAVMEPNGPCGTSATGTIVAVNPSDPTNTTTLATQAAHPAWQPMPAATTATAASASGSSAQASTATTSGTLTGVSSSGG